VNILISADVTRKLDSLGYISLAECVRVSSNTFT